MSSFYQHWRTGIGKDDDDRVIWYMDEKTNSAALWIRDEITVENHMVGNDNLLSRRVMAISGVPILSDEADVHMFVYGFADINSTPIIKHSPFTTQFYYQNPYSIPNNYTRVGYLRNFLMKENINSNTAESLINKFDLKYVIENYYSYTPQFISSMYSSKSILYDNGKIRVWSLDRKDT
jgi:hypothetical protein